MQSKEAKDQKAQVMAACDRVRDERLPSLGVRLEDLSDGSRWKLDDPTTLVREIEEKRQAQAQAQAEKKEKEKAKLTKKVEDARKALIPPTEIVKVEDAANYSKFGACVARNECSMNV